MVRRSVWFGSLLLALSACASPCSPGGLQVELDLAVPGDVVLAGACRVEGPLVVGPGVTLRGGTDSVLASGRPTDALVTLGEGARLESMSLDASGRAGVVMGPGAALLDVEVRLTHGVGVYAVGGAVSLEGVTIAGPVTADNALEPRWLDVAGAPTAGCAAAPCECDGDIDATLERVCVSGVYRTWTATLGLYVRDATVVATGLSVSGTAELAVAADNSTLVWTGGGVSQALGAGVLLRGGDAELNGVRIERVLAGLRGQPSYGLVSADGNELVTHDLSIVDGERYGLLQVGGRGEHERLTIEGNGDVAAWVTDAEAFAVRGESVLRGNGFAGMVVDASDAVHLEGLLVEDTATVRRNIGDFGARSIGDGIQLIRPGNDVVLRDVTVRGNERVGLLVDEAASVTFVSVTASSSGEAYGALAGDRDVSAGSIVLATPAGWDTGISRVGEAATNDGAASGAFDAIVTPASVEAGGVLGIIAPMY